MSGRPDYFTLDASHPLHTGLQFAGLAPPSLVKTTRYEDSSLYGNHGTLTAMDPATDWLWDDLLQRWCCDFARAQSQYINCGDPASLKITGSITVSCWSFLSSIANQTTCELIAKDSTSNRAYILDLSRNDAYSTYGGCRFLINGGAWGSPAKNIAMEGANPVTGVWRHAAGTYDGTTLNIYVNGVKKIASSSADASIGASAANMCIGRLETTGAESYMNGKICDALIHNRVLSTAEIAILANPADPMLGGLILPPRRRLWGGAVSASIEGTTVWGNTTGDETNKFTFASTWTGTGAISGEGDAEKITLDDGEYMESGVVHSGAVDVTLLIDKYGTGDGGATLKYRHAATAAGVTGESYVAYSAPFTSAGYVQVRVEN